MKSSQRLGGWFTDKSQSCTYNCRPLRSIVTFYRNAYTKYFLQLKFEQCIWAFYAERHWYLVKIVGLLCIWLLWNAFLSLKLWFVITHVDFFLWNFDKSLIRRCSISKPRWSLPILFFTSQHPAPTSMPTTPRLHYSIYPAGKGDRNQFIVQHKLSVQ